MPCNEADAVRSARLKGKKLAIKIENKNRKNFKIMVLEKINYIYVNKLIIKSIANFL
jgi:hypothetical protein